MKKSVSNNILKALTGVMLFAVPMLVACEKENTASNNNDGTGGNTQPKHNVELKYDGRTNEGCVNIAMDTIHKYNKDETVDSIFMIPDPNTQFATWNATQMRDAVNYLRERHNVNTKKVFGKGDLKLSGVILDQNPEIVRFFADTLKYNVR
jgi:hypothetical protein